MCFFFYRWGGAPAPPIDVPPLVMCESGVSTVTLVNVFVFMQTCCSDVCLQRSPVSYVTCRLGSAAFVLA